MPMLSNQTQFFFFSLLAIGGSCIKSHARTGYDLQCTMAPRRNPITRHYKISNDVLILILRYLDSISLWRACKVRSLLINAEYSL